MAFVGVLLVSMSPQLKKHTDFKGIWSCKKWHQLIYLHEEILSDPHRHYATNEINFFDKASALHKRNLLPDSVSLFWCSMCVCGCVWVCEISSVKSLRSYVVITVDYFSGYHSVCSAVSDSMLLNGRKLLPLFAVTSTLYRRGTLCFSVSHWITLYEGDFP